MATGVFLSKPSKYFNNNIADFSFDFLWLPPGWKQNQLPHLTHRSGWRICEVLWWPAFTPHAWSEVDANRGAAAEVEALGEQQPNLGNSWVWTHETSAHQRHYCTRLLVHQSRKLHKTQADVVKETRPLTWITVVRVCTLWQSRPALDCSCRQMRVQ